MNDFRSFCAPVAVTCEDDTLALGERKADGVPCFSSHEDGVTASCAFEEFEVFGKVPRKIVSLADDSLRSHGDHGCEFHRISEIAKIVLPREAHGAPDTVEDFA